MRSWTNLGIDRRGPGYCRVTFDHPPINAITATTVAELAELVELIEADADLNVVVFDSANAAFYLTHNDTENDPNATAVSPLGATGIRAWHDVLGRLSCAPVVSIAAIRGHVSGAGSEFVLACDLRFASRESTVARSVWCWSGCGFPGAVRWAGYPGWRVEAARSRSSSRPTISMERERSSTGTSTG